MILTLKSCSPFGQYPGKYPEPSIVNYSLRISIPSGKDRIARKTYLMGAS